MAIQLFGTGRTLPEDLYNRIEDYRNTKWESSGEFPLERKCNEWFSQTYHVPENCEPVQQYQRNDDEEHARDEFKYNIINKILYQESKLQCQRQCQLRT